MGRKGGGSREIETGALSPPWPSLAHTWSWEDAQAPWPQVSIWDASGCEEPCVLGYRMRVSDETELTGPGDCWPCEGGAGISHTVSPRHSSTLHWMGLATLGPEWVREYAPQ